MRKLHITRKASIFGCFKKHEVYISDFENSELKICDIPCRKLGDILNDETVSFDIDNDVSRVFVIGGKRICDACCDSVHIFEGSEDIMLEGKCKFNPARHNAFNFDGEPDKMAKRYRANANRNGWLKIAGIVIILAVVAVGVAGLLL